MLTGLQYPVYRRYLQLEGYQINSYTSLVNIAWSLKIFFGMLSDCIPIFGYRRKSWILIGWLVALAACLYMACRPFDRPYCDPRGNATIAALCRRHNKLAGVPKEYLNESSRNNAHVFILASMVATMGYVMADCASDAMAVQYAQREPMATRGRLQTAIYT
ncbi:hypothetical protein As57867_022634, partial [Aphanomyces stellatus]